MKRIVIILSISLYLLVPLVAQDMLTSLPAEIKQENIFHYLSAKDLANVARVNKQAAHDVGQYLALHREFDFSGMPSNKVINILRSFSQKDSKIKKIKIRDIKLEENVSFQIILDAIRPFADSLESLDMSENDLSKINLAVLNDFKKLKELNLRICKVKQLPDFLKSLKRLKKLDLSVNDLRSPDVSWTILNELPMLTDLLLERCFLTSIPPAIKNLTNLKYLDLSRNEIPLESLDFLENFDRLEELRLNGCELKNIFIKEGLQHLKKLDVRGNNLVNLIFLNNSLALIELNLSHNDLSKEAFNILDALPKIKKLYLGNCKLKKIPEKIRNLTNLEALDMSHNSLLGSDFSIIENLSNLRELNFSSCHLDRIPHQLINLDKLEKINFGYNEINEINMDIFYQSKKTLKRLDLNECGLEELPQGLEEFKNIQFLDLGGNLFSGEDLSSLASLTKLEYLILQDCGISSLPKSFAAFSNLKGLLLDGNNLTQNDLPLLKQLIEKNNHLEELYLNGNALLNQYNKRFHTHKEIVDAFKEQSSHRIVRKLSDAPESSSKREKLEQNQSVMGDLD